MLVFRKNDDGISFVVNTEYSLATDVSMLPFGYSGRFRGREEILERIHDIFNKKLKTRVVLTGLGGAG